MAWSKGSQPGKTGPIQPLSPGIVHPSDAEAAKALAIRTGTKIPDTLSDPPVSAATSKAPAFTGNPGNKVAE